MGIDVFVFPTKDYDEILFFQSKQEMLKSAAAHPNVVIPILGGGNDTELDDMFQNVYCALRKHVDGVEDVSNFLYNLPPIGGLHDDSDDYPYDDRAMGGFHDW